jgi:porin
MRFGVANKNINQVDWTSSLGFTYQGLIKGRDEDVLGAAVTINHASNKYRLLSNADSTETDYEVTYRTLIYPWLAVQPSVQFIQHPNMDKSIKNAFLLGFRTEIAF